MFTLSTNHRYYLYPLPTDMRKSFDGLSGIVNHALGKNPTSREVFFFINRNRNRIKLLHWQRNAFVLYYKRLEEGTFELPAYDKSVVEIKIYYTQLVMLLDGISIKNLHKRKSYIPNNQLAFYPLLLRITNWLKAS